MDAYCSNCGAKLITKLLWRVPDDLPELAKELGVSATLLASLIDSKEIPLRIGALHPFRSRRFVLTNEVLKAVRGLQ